MKNEDITASEALFGFMGWLTSRREALTIGATHECSLVVKLIEKWCEANHLTPPRDDVYPHNLTHPHDEKAFGEEQ